MFEMLWIDVMVPLTIRFGIWIYIYTLCYVLFDLERDVDWYEILIMDYLQWVIRVESELDDCSMV